MRKKKSSSRVSPRREPNASSFVRRKLEMPTLAGSDTGPRARANRGSGERCVHRYCVVVAAVELLSHPQRGRVSHVAAGGRTAVSVYPLARHDRESVSHELRLQQ